MWILLSLVGMVITAAVGWGLADFANNFGPPGALEKGIVLALIIGWLVWLLLKSDN